MKYNDKNMKICEKLGAKQFQKLVFILEKVKYQIIEKCFPNIEVWYDNYHKRQLQNKLLKCDEDNRQQIIDYYRYSKLAFKKEITYHQNQNYHIDLNQPTLFSNYLKYNRQIHIKGLKGNIIAIIILIALKLFINNSFSILFNVLLGYNIVGSLINFQCINLQNYNLCRLENEQIKIVLKRREKKRKQDYLQKYGEGMKTIGRAFYETTDIPSIDEVISQVHSKEEKEQLLLYLKNQLRILRAQLSSENLECVKERKKIK